MEARGGPRRYGRRPPPPLVGLRGYAVRRAALPRPRDRRHALGSCRGRPARRRADGRLPDHAARVGRARLSRDAGRPPGGAGREGRADRLDPRPRRGGDRPRHASRRHAVRGHRRVDRRRAPGGRAGGGAGGHGDAAVRAGAAARRRAVRLRGGPRRRGGRRAARAPQLHHGPGHGALDPLGAWRMDLVPAVRVAGRAASRRARAPGRGPAGRRGGRLVGHAERDRPRDRVGRGAAVRRDPGRGAPRIRAARTACSTGPRRRAQGDGPEPRPASA